MKAPEHIKIARKEGAKAGLETLHTYLARNTNEGTNGLPTNIAMLDEIRSAGGFRKRGRNAGTFKNEDKAVAWYCNHFAKKFGTDKLPPVKGRGTRQVRKTTPQGASTEQVESTKSESHVDVNALLLAAIAAGATPEQLAAIVTAASEGNGGADPDVDPDNGVEDEDDDTNGATDDDNDGNGGTRTARRVNRGTTTPTEYPGPRDPDADATNGKLWTLNTEGPDFGYFLCVIDEDGNIVAGGDESLKNGECHELIAEIRA